MSSRNDTAIALDISIEMVRRHGLPMQISQDALDELNANPPAWLAQSRANRTGKKPVWVTLECVVCGYSETVRPKKWWPEFTMLCCHTHTPAELPTPQSPSVHRQFTYGVGEQFTGVTDVTE